MRRAVGALVRKDLRLELRAPQVVPAMATFAVMTFVVFHFALQRRAVEGDLAAGVLWVTLLFAAMLGISRLFVADREEGGLDGFLLAPVDRTALLVAKVAGAARVPRPARARRWSPPSCSCSWARRRASRGFARLALLLALADVGIAVVGTLVAALAVQTRARDLIVPLLALPLLAAGRHRPGPGRHAAARRSGRGVAPRAVAGRPRAVRSGLRAPRLRALRLPGRGLRARRSPCTASASPPSP